MSNLIQNNGDLDALRFSAAFGIDFEWSGSVHSAGFPCAGRSSVENARNSGVQARAEAKKKVEFCLQKKFGLDWVHVGQRQEETNTILVFRLSSIILYICLLVFVRTARE